MQPERWQRLNQLFDSALRRDAGARAEYLAEACGDDESLRREVEELLAAHERASRFIEEPAMLVAAQLAAGDDDAPPVGQTVAHYSVLRLLGAGGMGEVYLAQDTRLGRRVALKFLPEHLARDEDRVRRFRQEARAVSALSHPNIIVVHDIGEAGGRHFIATEFVEGETLRARLERPLPGLPEALDIATQVASALCAAHLAGVVHRDLKPENVMIRADGLVKVLDFGIAKLSGAGAPDVSPEAPTRAQVNTDPGTVMGTVSYMSPEQVRGWNVDARTDVWSLGVVVYEMVTGLLPFAGATPSDVIAAVLERDPPPLNQLRPDAPEELQHVIGQALAKDVNARCRMTELLNDLRRVRRSFDETLLEKPGGGGHRRGDPLASAGRNETDEAGDSGGAATNFDAARTTGPARNLARVVVRHKSASIFFLLASAIGLFLLFSSDAFERFGEKLRPRPATTWFEIKDVTKLTDTGKVVTAAVSPDGKYVAYVMNDTGQHALWVRQIVAAAPRQIVPASGAVYRGLTVSPDSNFIYYVASDKGAGLSSLYAVPAFGGAPRKVLEDVDSPISFSPGGKQFAFVRGSIEGGVRRRALMVADTDGTAVRTLAARPAPDFFSSDGPAWSPHGRSVIISATKTPGDGVRHMYLSEVSAADGAEKELTTRRWGWIGRVAWLGDGKGLVMPVVEKALGSPTLDQAHIMEVSYPGGTARRVTNDLSSYGGTSATADAAALVSVQFVRVANILTTRSVEDPGQARQITSGFGRYYDVSWTPEDRIIYVSEESGSRDIWEMEADGSGRRQLTFDTQSYGPGVSPDGRRVVFASNRAGVASNRPGALHLWLMDRDGSNLSRLTDGEGEFTPHFSPDGKWIIFTSVISGMERLSKVPAGGGEAVPLLSYPSRYGVFSPDGEWIACQYLNEHAKWVVGIVPAEGGPPVKTFDIPTDTRQVLRWASDGRAVTYIGPQEKLHDIWVQPLDGGKPVQLTHFTPDQSVLFFDWSRDGRRLALLRGLSGRDVVYLSRSQ